MKSSLLEVVAIATAKRSLLVLDGVGKNIITVIIYRVIMNVYNTNVSQKSLRFSLKSLSLRFVCAKWTSTDCAQKTTDRLR